MHYTKHIALVYNLYQTIYSFILQHKNYLSIVSGRRNLSTSASPVGVDPRSVTAKQLVGVGTEVISLGLEQVSGELVGSVTVVESQSRSKGRGGDTPGDSLGHGRSPRGVGLLDGVLEEVVEQQVLEVGVLSVSLGDVSKENGSDDATTSPHEGDTGVVELPAVGLGGLSDEHEALGVRDDLGGVKGLLELVDELLLVTSELDGLGARQNLGGSDTLLLEGRQASRKDGLADQGNGHTEIKGVDGGPLSGTLLASSVGDLLNERSSGAVVVLEDVSGDLNEEGVEDTVVPLGENVSNLLVGEASTSLHEVVGLTNELHVTVLNTVVNHLDEVAGTSVTDPVTAGLAISLGRDILEDLLDVGPGLLVSTGHDGGTVSGTLLSSGDTGTNKEDSLLVELLVSSVGVGEVRVTTVDDDIALLEVGEELLNERVDGLAGLDEENDSSGSLEQSAELGNGVGANDGLAWVSMSRGTSAFDTAETQLVTLRGLHESLVCRYRR